MPAGAAAPPDPVAARSLAAAGDHVRAGRLAEAAGVLDDLLRRAPRLADAWNLAGIVCQRRGDTAGAVRHFRQAAALGGGAGVLVNLGFAHQKLGEVEAAEGAYVAALRREPTLAFAWQKMGSLQAQRGRRERALDCYRRAVALGDDVRSHGEALYLRRYLADWDPAATPTPASFLDALARADRSDMAPTLLLALPEATPRQQRDAAALFARSQWRDACAAAPLAPSPRPGGAPLRIGYLSPDFREHAVAYLVTETIAAHDPRAVHVSLYAYGPPATGDRWRARAVAAAHRFVDIDALDDAAAAARIRDDGIDVLVDLAGFTGHGRPGIAARRPAATIAQWLGYIGTLGEPRLADYVIGDAIATPADTADQFSETLALLPRCFQPNGALAPLPSPPARSDHGLPDDAVVYCSFNQTWKLHPQVWDDWCAVLRGVPGSVLWLAAPVEAAGERNLRAEAAARGVDGARLVFAAPLPRDAHLARIALADLALDTFPYNSGTTASDALRAGVPLLAFPGTTFAGRMAASVLHAAGLDDCVLPDRAAVVARAIALGRDAAARGSLRARVPAAVRASTLFDPAAFARDLERLFAAMHAQRVAGRRGTIVLPAADPAG